MSLNKKRKLFGEQKTLTDIGFKVNKVTDADVSDKEQGKENEIGSDEPKEKVTRRFQEKWLSLYKWLKYDNTQCFVKCVLTGTDKIHLPREVLTLGQAP